MNMKVKPLEDVLAELAQNLYFSENQILDAFLKFTKKEKDLNIKQNLNDYLIYTRKQKDRMEEVCNELEIKNPKGKKSAVMEALLEEMKHFLNSVKESEI